MYRNIKAQINNNKLIVKLPDIGYEIRCDIDLDVKVDPITVYPDDLPDFQISPHMNNISTHKLQDAKTLQEINNITKLYNIYPESLDFENVYLGFIYSNEQDPNNHHWFLDFRNKNDKNVYTYFTRKISMTCPVTTKSWNDGIWHGRYVFNKNDLTGITDNEGVIIAGKPKPKKDTKTCQKIKKPENIPENCAKIRIRYSIREDIWFFDLLDKEDEQLSSIPCKTFASDCDMKGIITEGVKPKVSTIISVNEIDSFEQILNMVIVKRK